MALSLRTSLVALLVAGSLLPLAGLAALEYRAITQEQEARQLADFQAATLASALRAEDAARRGQDPLAATLPGEGVEALLVTQNGTFQGSDDATGQWSAFRALAGSNLSGTAPAQHPIDGRDVLVAWARVPAADADVVFLRAPIQTSLMLLLPFLVLVAFLASGVALLLVFVATRVLAPVARLERASQRLARGEWHERLPVTGPAEVRSLARAFNTMATRLQRQREDLDRLLEERTRDLIDRESDLESLRFTLAHEFREPLRSLRWMADDLLEGPLAADARKATLLLRRRIDDIDAVFRDLLRYEDVSRRAATMEPVELDALLDAALEAAQEAGPVDLESPVLPRIEGNRDLLLIAFTELLRNAARYARRSAAPAQVRVRVEEEADALTLHVDDRGPGIPPARREDALHLFQRLRRDVPGTGAGLAIARRAIERHGGTVALDESPGGGARVTIRLPKRASAGRPPVPERTGRRF